VRPETCVKRVVTGQCSVNALVSRSNSQALFCCVIVHTAADSRELGGLVRPQSRNPPVTCSRR
jgi:hypothetical protein